MLHDNAYSRVITRPQHPNRDPVARQAFLEMLSQLDADSNNEIYFCDEAGFEGDPRPRAKWVKRGSKPACQRTGSHLRMSVIGAVAPKSGELISLIVPQTDTGVFQIFLDEFVKSTQHKNSQGKKIIMILDNASWHKSTKLNWHHSTPVYLPPYSPDFNPIERLWREIKLNWLANWFATDEQQLVTKLYDVLSEVMTQNQKISSTTSYSALFSWNLSPQIKAP
jgi:transposase